MFGAVSSWLQAGEEAANALAEKAGFAIEQKQADAAAAAPSSAPSAPVWEAPTQAWTDTGVEWRTLVMGALRDENTYLISPKRLLEDDHVAERLRACPGLDLEAHTAPSEFERDTKPWLPCLLELDGMANLRYQLVPALVNDDNFWHNAVWRVRVLMSMKGVAAAMTFLRIVNTEPTEPSADPDAGRLRNVGRRDQGKYLDGLEASVLAFREAAEWGATKSDTLRAELSSCRSNLQLLRNLMAANDVEQIELAQSVRESVEFHKTKLAGHLADLDGADASALEANPQLAPSEGELYVEALELNAAVQSALREFAAWNEMMAGKQRELEVREASAVPVRGTQSHSEHRDAASASPRAGSPDATQSPAVVSAVTATVEEETAFSATVPWDDDDEDDI